MKCILDLSNQELKDYLFQNDSYVNFNLPIYFDFSDLFTKLITKIGNKNIKTLRSGSINIRDIEGVNYILLINKNGKYDWRPFQIIHPLLYIEMVYLFSDNTNWEFIKSKFNDFKNNGYIECKSLPRISENENSNKAEQIRGWWDSIEQQSIILGLDFKYMYHTDITDCYPSFYTHSISWALHGKDEMKKRGNRNEKKFLGNKIDWLIQDMSFGQTNGIPQGSNIMDFIAEIILGYSDILLSEKFTKEGINKDNIKILRYRDDYRIFTNDISEGEKILKIITEVLGDLGLKLSKRKTRFSNDIVKDSLKDDKYYWLINSKYSKSIDKELFIIKDIAEKYPNSGTLLKILQQFNKKLTPKKLSHSRINYKVFISILVNIMIDNNKTFPIISAIISKIIKVNNGGTELITKILKKFEEIPNTGNLEIWLQRITLKLDSSFNIYSSSLVKKVIDNDIELWNSKWIGNREIKKILKDVRIINDSKINEIDLVISNEEVSLFNNGEYKSG